MAEKEDCGAVVLSELCHGTMGKSLVFLMEGVELGGLQAPCGSEILLF